LKLIKASYEILTSINFNTMLTDIEKIGRICYKSEDKITPESSLNFIKALIKNGHEAMIEHINFSVKFICDRGISHELVRHRLCSFAQESTRYCNYSKDKFENQLTFILPNWFKSVSVGTYEFIDNNTIILKDGYESTFANTYFWDIPEVIWLRHMLWSEKFYLKCLDDWKAQEARSLLPNSLKTEIIMSANLREWRHFFKLRVAKEAHPQMQELIRPLLDELKLKIPIIFDDIIY